MPNRPISYCYYFVYAYELLDDILFDIFIHHFSIVSIIIIALVIFVCLQVVILSGLMRCNISDAQGKNKILKEATTIFRLCCFCSGILEHDRVNFSQKSK